MNKKLWRNASLFVIVTVGVTIALGPRPADVDLNTKLPTISSATPKQLEDEITGNEAKNKDIKPDNSSSIYWFDSSTKQKTPYAIVYLHGFSAGNKEGNPVAWDIAKKFGCNLYLPRLHAHGLNTKEPMLEYSEIAYLESAKKAVVEAYNLGNKVIIMGTSTGCTLALYIASGNPDIAGLIMYSPNIELFDKRSFILSMPWGLQVARTIAGGKYYSFQAPDVAKQYWTTKYRIEAILRMKNLLDETMTQETFNKIHQPSLLCYYYKNEKEQDQVVSVPAMLKMYDQLGTQEPLKRKVAIPSAGQHAIASNLWCKDIPAVEEASSNFMKEIMQINSIE